MEFRVTGLASKVVVITGGARGMGAAYVRGFLAAGAKVVAAKPRGTASRRSVLRWRRQAGYRW